MRGARCGLGAVLWLLLLALQGLPAHAGDMQVVEITVAPAQARLDAVARLTWTGTATPLHWELSEELQVHALSANGQGVPFTRQGRSLHLTPPQGARSLEWHYGGLLRGPAPPQLMAEGSWLPGDTAWIPRPAHGAGLPVTVTVTAPAGQRSAMTGTLLQESIDEQHSRATFRAHPGQPPSLFVGPYVVRERQHGGIRLRTYFHPGAQDLADAYLQDAAEHIDRFERVIGPYPYDSFFMVSAPHPVGLGYAGLTYVSRRILHLPFMRGQSLAHEVLHGWWGNAVQVAAGSGNWAEGLTTFMADYRGGGPADRDRMRREWLRDHAALPGAQDYPLSQFEARLHTRDLVVGYGKGAFLFEMLEQRIGGPAFDRGVALIYRRHRGASADWTQVQAAFETASGEPLGGFFSQWVERTGAPRLALSQVRFGEAEVAFTLGQSPGDYALRVPVLIETDRGEQRVVVEQQGHAQPVRVPTVGRPHTLRVDPQLQVFRQLVPGEAAPILREVTLAEAPQAVVVDAGAQELARALLSALMPQARPVELAQWNRAQPALVVALGEAREIASRLGLSAPAPGPAGASAWAWMAQGAPAATLVVAARDAAALAALLRPLPHYGRDSWLVFREGVLLERGTWQPSGNHALTAQR